MMRHGLEIVRWMGKAQHPEKWVFVESDMR